MRESLSQSEARRVALAAQGFGRSRPLAPGTRQFNSTMATMSTLQIDSVNVFARSHYMPHFSRLGAYDQSALDRLLFGRKSPYVEYWAHVASFIPASDWGLFAFRMDDFRARFAGGADSWLVQHAVEVDRVRAALAERPGARPSELHTEAAPRKRGTWWDWDTVKQALELLWLVGEVAISGRQGFERTYALADKVIPAAGLTPVPRADAIRELVRRAARAYGVATEADLVDYWRIKNRSEVRSAIQDLVDDEVLLPVSVSGWGADGGKAPAWLHRDAVVPRRLHSAAILTAFDPVVWFRQRAERLFGFEYRIEIYTPAAKRRYGYYSLPVLVGEHLVGRVDLKADRAASTLRVQSAWWEPSAPASCVDPTAQELRLAARWLGLDAISVSHWGDATDSLASVLSEADRHEAGPLAVAAQDDEQ